MPVCFFNSLHNGEFSNLLIDAAFSNTPFSGITSLPVKKFYLSVFSDDNVEILTVYCLMVKWHHSPK